MVPWFGLSPVMVALCGHTHLLFESIQNGIMYEKNWEKQYEPVVEIHICCLNIISASLGLMQASLCKIQELLKDHPIVFKDQRLPITL